MSPAEMGSVVWHGTPHKFDPETIEPRRSVFEAVFLTDDPVIAAYYAGEGGIVLGYEISDECMLLDVTSVTGALRATAQQMLAMDEYLRERHKGLTLGSVMAEYFQTPTDRWDHILPVIGHARAIGPGLLKALGFGGFSRDERYSWARGDRVYEGDISVGGFGEVVETVRRTGADMIHRASAILDPSFLRHVATCSIEDVARSSIRPYRDLVAA